ncbi:hypothetical protein [Pseudanabaena sp. FACHB-2040]|uniref:hypothetical protein n=1 Tax=Pseudanabaena sp. FACHB-2040 TaxID=2692859 RepID=UPI0016842B42|nr:hypothetical protein [Pseudanabaena sp. FACHB-2040]MBD2257023.1 hypothetical protein [Pseudanabaena sp. FACHB-2040]
MSQQDNFAGGFIAGALFGGMIGGVVGALTASRLRPSETTASTLRSLNSREQPLEVFDDATEESMEIARRRLEDKIAQLNEAIDDVRQQLGGINGYPQEMLDDSSLIDS